MAKSQLPVIEEALETAARMLGSDKSRGYCLEMICAEAQTSKMRLQPKYCAPQRDSSSLCLRMTS